MRIDGWHIDGFGVHADHHVTDLPAGLTIVAGPNESGKTTIQHFLVGMLFGFPPVNRADHHPPLRGGAYGGRLFVTTDDGEHLTIHRGARKSSLKVTHADGTAFEGDLGAVLGGATKELFQSVFAVHLSDLAELRALTEDQVRDRVFSAGIFGAGRSAQAALGQIGTARDALLRPSGRGASQMKELGAQLADARLRLAEAKRKAQDLPSLFRQLERLDARAATLHQTADQLRSEASLLDAVGELWPRWSAATDARHQLDQLGPIASIGPDAASQLHTSIGQHQAAAAAAATATEERATAAAAHAALDHPALELALLDDIDAAARQVDTERARAQRIEELDARARHQRSDLQAELALLGPDRGIDWLDARPTGTADASGLRQAAAAVGDARTDLRDATRAAEQLQADLALEDAELQRAESALDTLPTLLPDDAVAGLDAATSLAALATQREVTARRLADAEARRATPPTAMAPRSSSTWLIAGGAALVVAGLGAVAAGQPLVGLVLVMAAVALAIGGVATRGATTNAPAATDLDAVIDLAADELRRIDAELAGPLAVLRLDTIPSAAEATSIRAHADRVATAAQQADDQRRRVAEDRARHSHRAQRQLAASQQRLDAATAAVHEAESGWRSWLAANDLPDSLDPAGASDLLATIDRARTAARALAVVDTDLAAERAAADAYAERVRMLGRQVSGSHVDAVGEPDGIDALTLIDRLARIAAQQRSLHQQHAQAAAELERTEVAERRAGRARAEATEQLTANLRAIGAATVDEAQAILQRTEQAHQLQATITDAEARLDAATGSAPDRRAQALDLLTEADPAGWAERSQALKRRLHDIVDERDHCLHERSAIQAETDQLATSADVPRCELLVTGLEAELVEAVTTWASLTLAHQMVEGTLAKYQRERQPDVVKRAAVLFQQVTGGTYARLEVRDNEVFAIDRTEREVPASGLSQGTTEQLYLCMRIALAESFAKTASLPLLLDDITVNADPTRQQHLSGLLATVAETQQVFAFTCHDTVVEQLQALRPDARVIALQAHAAPGTAAATGPSATATGTTDAGPGITLAAG